MSENERITISIEPTDGLESSETSFLYSGPVKI